MENEIRLVPYSDVYYQDLVSYELDEVQQQYTALPRENLITRNVLADPQKHAVAILLDNKAIGFFVFDSGKDRGTLSDNPNAILLRSLSINPHYQGKGAGRQAMEHSVAYVLQHLPGYDEIVLAVNSGNTQAYHTYIKAGFRDSGRKAEGRSGPQYIMTRAVAVN